MTPALFALVDAVLAERRAYWRGIRWYDRNQKHAALFAESHYALMTTTGTVGWWRSLWPLGGGA